ncbi:MAG TPA: ribonuclease HI [Desulfobacterales bacterium]
MNDFDPADWKRIRFKRNKAWMAIDTAGNPVRKNGKFVIKYRLDQDDTYWVNPENVRSLDDPLPEPKSSSPSRSKVQDTPPEDTDPDTVRIYTDGASSGNPGPSGVGVVLDFRGHRKEISRYIGMATNNIAELEAVRTALQQLKRRDVPVRIYTDSNYVYGLLSQGWKAKKNPELVEDIRRRLKDYRRVTFIKVRGHAGHPENELADGLARKAVARGTQ